MGVRRLPIIAKFDRAGETGPPTGWYCFPVGGVVTPGSKVAFYDLKVGVTIGTNQATDVINSTQSISGVPYLFRYQYNPAGGLTSIEYPSAIKVS